MPCLDSIAPRLGRGVVTVVPVTSNTGRVHPFQVLLRSSETGLTIDSKAQAEQIRSVAVERIGVRIGVVPAGVLGALDEALRLHLAPLAHVSGASHRTRCPRRRPGTKADESRGLGGSNRLTLPSAIRPRPTVHRDGTESVYP